MRIVAFSNVKKYIFKKDFTREYFELIQSFKRRTNVMTRCRTPEFCAGYEVGIGIYDLKSKRKLPRSVNQTDTCLYIHENHYCVVWKKNKKDSLVNGLGEKEEKLKYVKK